MIDCKWQAGNPGKNDVAIQNECHEPAKSLLSSRGSVFILLRPSPEWMRTTNIMEGDQLYLKFTNLKVNFIPKNKKP